jgi:polysaccharide pyruvyl transferase WcaK-like protein
MNFSLIGHGGFFNRGCEAIIRTTVGLLGSGFRHPQITLASGDPDNDKRLPLEQRIKIVSSAPLRGIWTPLSPAWILRQVRKLHSSEKSRETALLPMIGLIKRSDIVLSVGGDNFTPEYGFPEYWFTLHDLVRKHGKKLVVWSASIGPFPKDDHLPYIVRSFKAADLITARDSATVGYLKEIGITRNVRKVADTAFLLPAQKVYDHFVLPDTRKDTVGINLSPLPGYLKDRSIDMDAVDEMARFIERLGDFAVGIAQAQIAAAAGRLSGLYIWGDIAYVKGMFFSPEYWRSVYKPQLKRICDVAHAAGLKTIYHGCGNASKVYDDMIEAGVDAYNPMEAKARLHVVDLKRRYGQR